MNYLQATVGCEETFSQVCSNLNNLSSEVREPNLLKTVNCYNYLDEKIFKKVGEVSSNS